MQFRNITIENEIRVRGDASQWLGAATLQGGQPAYEIRDGETVFGVGFRDVIQTRVTRIMGGGMPQAEIADRIFDKQTTPHVQVKGYQNTMPDNPLEAIGLRYTEAVIRSDGLDHIKAALTVLRRRSPSALILTNSDDRARLWVEALKQSGKNVVNADSKSGDHSSVSVATVSGFLSELAGKLHAWDTLKLDPGMLIVDQCELIPVAELKKAVRSVRPAFRLGIMQKPPMQVVDMQALCHEMGPWVFGRPEGSLKFCWASPL
jgi:hypothetical protein